MYQANILSNKYFCCSLLGWLVFFCCLNCARAQHAAVIRKADFGKYNQIFLNDSLWFFHPGDLVGSNSNLTTKDGWEPIHSTVFGKSDAPRMWPGMGWFALWIKVDKGLVGDKLALRINHDGASEIFLDGRPIGGYGQVGNTAQQMEAIRAPRDLIPLWFPDTNSHLLTIRYSNFFGVYSNFLGFELSLGDYAQRAEKVRFDKQLLDYLPMFAVAQLILGLLHFLFFLFYPRQKLNAYYALLVLLIGINGISVYQYYFTPYPSVQYLADFLTCVCKVLIMWSAVFLLYVLNYGRVPVWRTTVLTGIMLFYVVGYILKFWVFRAIVWDDHFSLVYFVCILDGLWSAVQLIRRKQKDAWIIGVGVFTVVLVYVFAWADVFSIWPYNFNAVRLFVMGAASLVLPFCLSLYLALDFARTSKKLRIKLEEIAELSARALVQETEKTERIASEARRLEQIVELRTAELKEQATKLLEMDAMKSRFFTNITHEFKTPLTLIINPAKELFRSSEGKTNEYLRIIISNAERLLKLINQLLDLSKIESGVMNIRLTPVNLVALLRVHVLSFESLAQQRGTGLSFVSDCDNFWILIDRDKVEKIILNLLSNAVKFTDKGMITIKLCQNQGSVESRFTLTVTDTGKGISAAKLPYVFSRFYQADPSDTRSAEGTGIGLALAKELVDLMDGKIEISSVEGFFTEVRIVLPYLVSAPTNESALNIVADEASIPCSEKSEIEVVDEHTPLVLLIEDHDELREFVRQSLAAKYRVISASNGAEGINLAQQFIPNLIITDLMMPIVSGYEVSTTLKSDEKTSHIPIIIVTAKADVDSRIQGIETGADAYLSKPFDQRELLAIIEHLISAREQLRIHYSNNTGWLKDTCDLPSIEQAFMTRVRQAVESHLNEEGYSADQLASDMYLSRTQLHRKLKGLIGQAPGELIRVVRLQHAHNLLKHRAATVAEVAYMVGFSSPASFSASFSRHFGFAPSKVSVN